MSLATFHLQDRRAIVTGGSRGLGRIAALALAEAGADIALVGRDAAALTAVAAEVQALGRRAVTVVADLTVVAECGRMAAEAAAALGSVDILVNNAGMNIPRPALEVTEADWDQVIDINLKGTFFCAQAVGRIMIDQGGGGRIINVSSQMGVVGYYKRAAYCAAKHGVIGLTKVLAVEWASHRILVNAIAPTFIRTELSEKFLSDPAFGPEVLRRIPLGRFGEPEEIAGSIVYLASDAASLVTGHTLLIDGGYTAW